MKIGDRVTLIGHELLAKYRGKRATIVEIENNMLTVVCQGQTLLVFTNEVSK